MNENLVRYYVFRFCNWQLPINIFKDLNSNKLTWKIVTLKEISTLMSELKVNSLIEEDRVGVDLALYLGSCLN